MAAVARQRLFNAVFPPEDSPFVPGTIKSEVLQSQKQNNWDVVTRILRPSFATGTHTPKIEDRKSHYNTEIMRSMVQCRTSSVEWPRNCRATVPRDMVSGYLVVPSKILKSDAVGDELDAFWTVGIWTMERVSSRAMTS